MLRILRLNKILIFGLIATVYTIICHIIGMVEDDDVVISVIRYINGFLSGTMVMLYASIISKKKNELNERNHNPKFDYTLLYVNYPMEFGMCNDIFGKDLLEYLPFKIPIYTIETTIDSHLSVMCVSYSKFKNRLRVFNMINIDAINKKIHDNLPNDYHVRLIYDIDLTNTSKNNLAVFMREIAIYNAKLGNAFIINNDIYKLHKNINEVAKEIAIEMCDDIMKLCNPLSEGFEYFIKKFIEANVKYQCGTKQYYNEFKRIEGIDIEDLSKNANIEILNDDYLTILPDINIYLQ